MEIWNGEHISIQLLENREKRALYLVHLIYPSLGNFCYQLPIAYRTLSSNNKFKPAMNEKKVYIEYFFFLVMNDILHCGLFDI